MESNILCLGAGPTTTEALKNLVLPGCGFITIVDSKISTERDLGNNFFIEPNDIGKPLAEVVLKYLIEMNDDVNGKAIVCNCQEFINKTDFSKYSLVIASQIDFNLAAKLDSLCRDTNTPLIYCKSYGFLGYMRISVKEHTTYDGKYDKKYDLRLYKPFKKLDELADKLNTANFNSDTQYTIPFPILLIQAMRKWKSTHDNNEPKRNERNEFNNLYYFIYIRIKSLCSTNDSNVEEAVNNSYYVLTPSSLPNDLEKVFNNPNVFYLYVD